MIVRSCNDLADDEVMALIHDACGISVQDENHGDDEDGFTNDQIAAVLCKPANVNDLERFTSDVLSRYIALLQQP